MKAKKGVTKVSLGAHIQCSDSIGRQIVKYAERKRWLDLSQRFQSQYYRCGIKTKFENIYKTFKRELVNGA